MKIRSVMKIWVLDEVTLIRKKWENHKSALCKYDPILVWTTSKVREIEKSKSQHYEVTITPLSLARLWNIEKMKKSQNRHCLTMSRYSEGDFSRSCQPHEFRFIQPANILVIFYSSFDFLLRWDWLTTNCRKP